MGCRVLSIHNSPEDLKLPSKMQHLQMKLADVDTQDISPFFDPSYDFIEAGIHANEGEHTTSITPLNLQAQACWQGRTALTDP